MNSAVDSRKRVLDDIHAATPNSAVTPAQAVGAYGALTRNYVRCSSMSAEAQFKRMAERLREYDAEVVECTPEELAATIAAQLSASGRQRFLAPEGLPAKWLAEGFKWKIDRGMVASEVEKLEGVVTECTCGVADSGTIILHHSRTEGRRVITLLPDWHLCILRASQIVETLPEYFDRCERARTEELGTRNSGTLSQRLPVLVTWISGPSATSDIEMTRIKGVHGPRFLHVILVKDRK